MKHMRTWVCAPCLCLWLSPVVSPSRQGGTEYDDYITCAVMGPDDSVVLAGYTRGNWSTENGGGVDFAAVKLDADGREVWRWQVGHN